MVVSSITILFSWYLKEATLCGPLFILIKSLSEAYLEMANLQLRSLKEWQEE